MNIVCLFKESVCVCVCVCVCVSGCFLISLSHSHIFYKDEQRHLLEDLFYAHTLI